MAFHECWFAVFTGDVVDSRGLGSHRSQVMAVLQRALQETAQMLYGPEAPAYASGIFRGDSFQMAAADCVLSLRALLGLKATLLSEVGIKIRVNLALGPVENLDGLSVERSHGPAFVLSGRMIDDMPTYRHLSIGSVDRRLDSDLAVLGTLLDVVVQRWTRAQGQALVPWLSGMTQAEIATRLGITQPAVQQRIRSAGGFALSGALDYFEDTISSRIDNLENKAKSL